MLQTYYHKKEKFTLRSLKAVEEYEISGTLPQRKRKAEEMEIIIVDKKIKVSTLFLNIYNFQHVY